jgi:hypothetical protein
MNDLQKKEQEFNENFTSLVLESTACFKNVLDKLQEHPDFIDKVLEDTVFIDALKSQYQFVTSVEQDKVLFRCSPVAYRAAISAQLDVIQQLDTRLALNIFPTRNFKTIYGTLDVGTWKQGEVQISFERLVKVFGQPWYYTDEPGNKSDVEWPLLFDDGTVATIYNYKNGKNYAIYSDGDGDEIEDIFDWSIGGRCPEAATLVKIEIATFKFQD